MGLRDIRLGLFMIAGLGMLTLLVRVLEKDYGDVARHFAKHVFEASNFLSPNILR